MLLIIVMAVPVFAGDEVTCTWCGEISTFTTGYEPWTHTYHAIRGWCDNCGEDIYQGTNAGVHHFCHDYDTDYDVCEECGYEIECECGEAQCDHYDTYTEWDDCDWYEYCSDCDELLDEGTEHSDYAYDDWEYYTSSKHRRYYYCEVCGGDDGYETDYHDTDIEYNKYDSTRHEVVEYCYDCDSEIDGYRESHGFSYSSWSNYSDSQHRRSINCYDCGYSSYEYSSHSLSYGSWTSYNGSQHRRTVSCSTCGYSTYEYANHLLTTGSWTSASSTQHTRKTTCSCGYSTTETASHSLTYGAWTKYSDAQHKRTVSCLACSYSSTEYADHSVTTGSWTSISDTQHSRTVSCSCGYSIKEQEDHTIIYGDWESCNDAEHSREVSCDCGYSDTEYDYHTDDDFDGYCDECDGMTARFSVTLPAVMTLVVSGDGEVYAADNAAIVNNSTDKIIVSSVTVSAGDNWTLVPYRFNMANVKVDSRLIGFSLNNLCTTAFGYSETLELPERWIIDRDTACTLEYDAVVSAASDVIQNEQVLTIVFVVNWLLL